MFSEKLTSNDFESLTDKKWALKKKLVLFAFILLIIIIIILIIVIITSLTSKSNEPKKEEEKEEYIENIENYLIADFIFNYSNNAIINIGLVNTSKIINYKTENGYFYDGQVKLNKAYNNCTIIAIAKYNRSSTQKLFENFAYYGGAIDFKELTEKRQRIIGILYAGGEISTNYIFPNHSYLNKYYDGKYLVENEDIFFALSTNGLNDKNGGKFYVQVNEDYHEKKDGVKV